MLEKDKQEEEMEKHRIEMLRAKQNSNSQLAPSEEKLLRALEEKMHMRQKIEDK